MNKVILIGRLTCDPVLRMTQTGKQVVSYRIAVNRSFRQEGQPEADFFQCIAWGNNAKFAHDYLRKGVKIAMEGTIQTRSYQDKDGKTVYVTEIIADRQEFCESKGAASQEKFAQDNAESEQALPKSDVNGFVEVDDDDLPF